MTSQLTKKILTLSLLLLFAAACNSGDVDMSSTDTNGNGNPAPAGGGGSESDNANNGTLAPYAGSPVALPGTVIAVNFDTGGEGVAYHDKTTGNDGGQYRPDESVDIAENTDSIGGPWIINEFQTGEWLKYTVDVASDGRYTLELRASSAVSGASYLLEVDGENVTGTIRVPNTGSWKVFRWIGRSNIPLSAGKHVIRLISEQEYFNFNSLRVSTTPVSGPYAGEPHTAPGPIEAEDFDFGGEGVAYHDTDAVNHGGEYRPTEGVDIAATDDADGGLYEIIDLEAGEWLTYTIYASQSGDFDIAIRAAGDGAARIELNGKDIGGPIGVSGSSHSWAGTQPVTLAAGQHVLRVVGERGTVRLNRIRIAEMTAAAAIPYHGSPAIVPGTIQAEDFDFGGEGIAYHDSVVGNSGGAYRPDTDVDISQSTDVDGGAFDVVDFATGEWLSWTIDVAVDGNYDIDLRVSSITDSGAFRIELDEQDVTGPIVVPNTGNWSAYQWTGAQSIPLASGTHRLKLFVEQEFFNLNSLRLEESAGSERSTIDPASILFSCAFLTSANDCGFRLQSKDPTRASLSNIAREGLTAVRLRTEPGDSDVAGSGTAERTDLWISQDATGGYEGHEAWWAHSILFPDDYVVPPSGWGVVFDFHNTASGAWQANFHVDAGPNGLSFRGYGGAASGDGRYTATIGPVQRNVWYDFVYHVRWSSGNDGFFEAWVNGEKVLSHSGPTLYDGQGVYLKLANYHSPFGQASSIIHDRVIYGTAPEAVSDGPLEGVLELVDGILTPVLP